MKGISSHAAVNAYQQAGVRAVGRSPVTSSVQQNVAREDSAAKVSISREARTLADDATSQVDTQKLEALRTQVEAGVYRIDSRRIASLLLGQQ